MICTDFPKTTKLPPSRASIRRVTVVSTLALGLCGVATALAAEPSSDATPAPLNMSIIQGLSNTVEGKADTPAPAAPVAAPEPAVKVTPAPAERHSQVVVVEMPSGAVQRPAAGSPAAAVEARLSAFDMGTIRALVSPEKAAADGQDKPESLEAGAPLQSTKAPAPMAAPASQGAAMQQAPAPEKAESAASQPLPASQMELIEEVFKL